jgi:hypothetical protein
LAKTYKTQPILQANPAAPEGREAVAMEIVQALPSFGLTSYTDAWIVNKVDDKAIENFLPCLQYFLINWERINNSQPLPLGAADVKKPGIIVTLSNDPLTSQEYPGYRKQTKEFSVKVGQSRNVSLTMVSLQPE